MNNLTSAQRVKSFVALYTSSFTWGMSYAGLIPLMSVLLEGNNTHPVIIGLVAAANPIGVLIGAPLVSPILKRFGTANSIIISMIIAAAAVIAMPFLTSAWWWLLLRLIAGISGAVPWVATETWINIMAKKETRGRLMATYGGVMAAGFAVGPILLTTVGTGGLTPFICFTIIINQLILSAI